MNKKEFNRFVMLKDSIAIQLLDRHGNLSGVCYIDHEDLSKVSDRRWHLDHKGYCRSSCTFNKTYIHNLIMGIRHTYKLGVDHIDRNPLNNKRSNLRLVSHKENIHNRGKFRSNTSGISGVCLESSRNRWRACFRGKFLGRTKTKEEASYLVEQAKQLIR